MIKETQGTAYSARRALLYLGREDDNLEEVEKIAADMERLSGIEAGENENVPLATRIYKATNAFFDVKERIGKIPFGGHDLRASRLK